MKSKYNILTLLLIIPALLISCQEETVVPPGPPVGDEVEILFSIVTDGETRAGTDSDEKYIKDVDILVFKEGYFVERAIGEEINNTPGTKDFKVKLTTNNAPNNYLIAIANARHEINQATLRGRKDDVLSTIIFEETNGRWPAKLDGSTEFRPIPMFGEYGPLKINETLQDSLKNKPIPMYRALARVDVTLDNSVSNFKLTEVHFYKYNTKGRVAPGPNAAWDDYHYSSDPKNPARRVTNITVPDNINPVEGFLSYDLDSESSLASSIYVMEIDRAEREDYDNATCLVVGGKYGGSDDVTYYRIDFEIIWRITQGEFAGQVIIEAGVGDAVLGRSFARMLRNHAYDITITKVSGPGATTKEEARKRKKNELEVYATTWYVHTLNVELK